MQTLQGKLTQAWITLQKVQLMAVGPNGESVPPADLLVIGLGDILIERNLLAEANVYLERAMKASGTICLLSNLARLRQIQSDISGSQAVIEDALQLALSSESSQWDESLVSAIAVRLALQRGDLPDAKKMVEQGQFSRFHPQHSINKLPLPHLEYLAITQVRRKTRPSAVFELSTINRMDLRSLNR